MKITYWIAALLIVLTVLINLSGYHSPKEAGSVLIPASPLEKSLFYDWPKAFELFDKITDQYGQNRKEIPKTALEELSDTSYWQGFLPEILGYPTKKAPWFEKISEGQVWRLFTPALMHVELWHLTFNLFWLIVLGRLLEERIGAWKYLLLTLIFGIGSNTAQYLMSGMFFLGYSGVISGLFGFIYLHRKIVLYPLPKSLFTTTFIFIFGMAAVNAASIYFRLSFGLTIANTAHIAGLLLGLVAARFFQHEQT